MGGVALFAGPLVALVGILSVVFVMRHRHVQTKSMYSARRGQIERKVRAARQRTLAPTGKHPEGEAPQVFVAPGMEAKTAVPTATWGPPTSAPAASPAFPPPPAVEPAWEVGPTVPPPPAPEPSPPAYAPAEPAYTPPPPAPAEEWAPAAAQPVAPPSPEPTFTPAEPPVSTPAGGGAAWSIVGDNKASAADPVVSKKKSKKEKHQPAETPWMVASGIMPGDEAGDEIKTPSVAIAIAQYAVLVVGLVMVLIGVVVMVANSHVT